MKVLIVGGTGLIGGHTASSLASQGDEVVLAARKPAAAATPMSAFRTILGDYAQGGFSEADLAPFDAILFAAGNDIRHLPNGADENEFWTTSQIEGVPDFVEIARRAGVRRLVHIGSYYHQVMPNLIETNAYVRGRSPADEAVRSLSTDSFNVCALNPPSILGYVPGLPTKRFDTLMAYARGEMKDTPLFAPPGGTNYMSVHSLAEAIHGALRNAEAGKAYLVGDENMTFQQYFQMLVDALGNPTRVETVDREHPLLPDFFIVPGRGKVLAYEPDFAETAVLCYRRGHVRTALAEGFSLVTAQHAK